MAIYISSRLPMPTEARLGDWEAFTKSVSYHSTFWKKGGGEGTLLPQADRLVC